MVREVFQPVLDRGAGVKILNIAYDLLDANPDKSNLVPVGAWVGLVASLSFDANRGLPSE